MSKTKFSGFMVLGAGAVLGIFLGGPLGLGLVAVCLVVGFGLWFATEAKGVSGPVTALTPRILVLLKDVQVRPQRAGRFQEIGDPNETGLEFEVFVHCWLVNESDVPVAVTEELQLSLRIGDGSIRIAEWVRGDLELWRLGSLVQDEWDPEVVHTRQEEMPELSLEKPLDCGVPREGWLHFRFLDATPHQLKNSELRLSTKDVFSNNHEGLTTGPVRHLPGSVWPCAVQGVSAPQSGK
jgi:hypothetical protein